MPRPAVWILIGRQHDFSSHTWHKYEQIPIPVADVHFVGLHTCVKDGNFWEHVADDDWVNRGPLAIAPVAADQSTWGKAKAVLNKKGDKR